MRSELAAVFNAPIMAHAQWGVVVRSLETGDVLFELNPRKLMMPASNMKIVTLACAAEVLGWDHRFVTTLETSGSIEGTALVGDLVVRGGGDPTINERDGRNAAVLSEWAAALRALGITRITGRIVGDDQSFEQEGLGGGWSWDDLQYGYAAPVGALQFNENIVELLVTPAAQVGAPAAVQLAAGSGLTVSNRTLTGPAGTAETISLRRYSDRLVLEVTGSVPLLPPGSPGEPARTVRRQVAVVNPTHYFVHSVKEGLGARGISVEGEVADMDDLPPQVAAASERRVLVRTESPPLREMAGVLMKVSQNQYAETLLKALGAGSGLPASVSAGRAAVLRSLGQWQLDQQALILSDGSGLSRYNYVTAGLIADILTSMYTDPRHREPFLASLPLAGKEGTVATRLRRTRAERNAMVKTGSIANVRSLSGYLRTRDGEMVVFAVLANDFNIPAATVNWITDLGVEVLANFTRSRVRRSAVNGGTANR